MEIHTRVVVLFHFITTTIIIAHRTTLRTELL
jgi:hypothetical protein